MSTASVSLDKENTGGDRENIENKSCLFFICMRYNLQRSKINKTLPTKMSPKVKFYQRSYSGFI